MGNKRVLVGYGLDVDAVANHINTTKGGPPNLTNVSRGAIVFHVELPQLTNLRQAFSVPPEA